MRDPLPVVDDVQVVTTELRFIDPVHVEQVPTELIEELRLAVLVQSVVSILAQTILERLHGAAVEEPHHPSVEDQILVEAALPAWSSGHQTSLTSNMASRNAG